MYNKLFGKKSWKTKKISASCYKNGTLGICTATVQSTVP